MRFRYSSVSDWIAGSFVFPIHAILIFTEDNQPGKLLFVATSSGRGSALARRCLCFRRGFRPRRRLQFRGLKPLGRLPQALQIVELARLLGKNMYDKISVVDQD